MNNYVICQCIIETLVVDIDDPEIPQLRTQFAFINDIVSSFGGHLWETLDIKQILLIHYKLL